MSKETALEFDQKLSAIPLFVKEDDGSLEYNQARNEFIRTWALEHGVSLEPPAPSEIGCKNCLLSDRLRHPELTGHLYCARCPMNDANTRN